jgi:SAM-dependent methyltransferase
MLLSEVLTDAVLRVLCCPFCREALKEKGDTLTCGGQPTHTFSMENGLLTFADIDPGKYDKEYAGRYAALWAYGYATEAQRPLGEYLYRTVSSLVSESLASRPADAGPPVIVDAGCGVGRISGDCAALDPTATVIGLDGSFAMLDFASRVVRGSSPILVDLANLGFGHVEIQPRGLDHVFFARANVERLPVAGGCADLALSINMVDRLPRGPEVGLKECHRILRSGGWLIFTDPLNWQQAWLWAEYGTSEAIRELLETYGFEIKTWVDDLPYREIIDARGSFNEFKTLVVAAKKKE